MSPRRYYVLTVLRGGYQTEILRKIWFDRADLHLVRAAILRPQRRSPLRRPLWQLAASRYSTAPRCRTIPAPFASTVRMTNIVWTLPSTKLSLNEAIDS